MSNTEQPGALPPPMRPILVSFGPIPIPDIPENENIIFHKTRNWVRKEEKGRVVGKSAAKPQKSKTRASKPDRDDGSYPVPGPFLYESPSASRDRSGRSGPASLRQSGSSHGGKGNYMNSGRQNDGPDNNLGIIEDGDNYIGAGDLTPPPQRRNNVNNHVDFSLPPQTPTNFDSYYVDDCDSSYTPQIANDNTSMSRSSKGRTPVQKGKEAQDNMIDLTKSGDDEVERLPKRKLVGSQASRSKSGPRKERSSFKSANELSRPRGARLKQTSQRQGFFGQDGGLPTQAQSTPSRSDRNKRRAASSENEPENTVAIDEARWRIILQIIRDCEPPRPIYRTAEGGWSSQNPEALAQTSNPDTSVPLLQQQSLEGQSQVGNDGNNALVDREDPVTAVEPSFPNHQGPAFQQLQQSSSQLQPSSSQPRPSYGQSQWSRPQMEEMIAQLQQQLHQMSSQLQSLNGSSMIDAGSGRQAPNALAGPSSVVPSGLTLQQPSAQRPNQTHSVLHNARDDRQTWATPTRTPHINRQDTTLAHLQAGGAMPTVSPSQGTRSEANVTSGTTIPLTTATPSAATAAPTATLPLARAAQLPAPNSTGLPRPAVPAIPGNIDSSSRPLLHAAPSFQARATNPATARGLQSSPAHPFAPRPGLNLSSLQAPLIGQAQPRMPANTGGAYSNLQQYGTHMGMRHNGLPRVPGSIAPIQATRPAPLNAAQTGVVQTGAMQTGAVQTGAVQTRVAQAGVAKPKSVQPGTKRPAASCKDDVAKTTKRNDEPDTDESDEDETIGESVMRANKRRKQDSLANNGGQSGRSQNEGGANGGAGGNKLKDANTGNLMLQQTQAQQTHRFQASIGNYMIPRVSGNDSGTFSGFRAANSGVQMNQGERAASGLPGPNDRALRQGPGASSNREFASIGDMDPYNWGGHDNSDESPAAAQHRGNQVIRAGQTEDGGHKRKGSEQSRGTATVDLREQKRPRTNTATSDRTQPIVQNYTGSHIPHPSDRPTNVNTSPPAARDPEQDDVSRIEDEGADAGNTDEGDHSDDYDDTSSDSDDESGKPHPMGSKRSMGKTGSKGKTSNGQKLFTFRMPQRGIDLGLLQPPRDPSIPKDDGIDRLSRMPNEILRVIYHNLVVADDPIKVQGCWSQLCPRQGLDLHPSILSVSKRHEAAAMPVLYGENEFRYVLRDDALIKELEDGEGRTLPLRKYINSFRYLILEVEPNRIGPNVEATLALALQNLIGLKATNLKKLTIDVSPRKQDVIVNGDFQVSQCNWFWDSTRINKALEELSPKLIYFDVHLEQDDRSTAKSLRRIIETEITQVDVKIRASQTNRQAASVKIKDRTKANIAILTMGYGAGLAKAKKELRNERITEQLERMGNRMREAIRKGVPYVLQRKWFVEFEPLREQRKSLKVGYEPVVLTLVDNGEGSDDSSV